MVQISSRTAETHNFDNDAVTKTIHISRILVSCVLAASIQRGLFEYLQLRNNLNNHGNIQIQRWWISPDPSFCCCVKLTVKKVAQPMRLLSNDWNAKPFNRKIQFIIRIWKHRAHWNSLHQLEALTCKLELASPISWYTRPSCAISETTNVMFKYWV